MTTLQYDLRFANIPFIPDQAQLVRLPADKDQFKNVDLLPPRKYQPCTCFYRRNLIPFWKPTNKEFQNGTRKRRCYREKIR